MAPAVYPRRQPRLPGPDKDPDAEWLVDADTDAGAVLADYRSACARSNQIARAAGSLEEHARRPESTQYSLRWILVHMVEETARHAGHADILRELLVARATEAGGAGLYIYRPPTLAAALPVDGDGLVRDHPPVRHRPRLRATRRRCRRQAPRVSDRGRACTSCRCRRDRAHCARPCACPQRPLHRWERRHCCPGPRRGRPHR